jgi:secreted trypsin-like serine protease
MLESQSWAIVAAHYRRNSHISPYIADPTSITFDYDIMLVKLATPSTAPLQQINFDPIFPPVGSEVSVIGYGHTSENGTVSPILLQTQNTILSFEDCNEFYKTISEERMICMGDAAGGRDSCQGDSGGPMFYNGIQVGVVRYAQRYRKTANARRPSFVTNLTSQCYLLALVMAVQGHLCLLCLREHLAFRYASLSV